MYIQTCCNIELCTYIQQYRKSFYWWYFHIVTAVFSKHQCKTPVKINELHWRHLRSAPLNIYTDGFLKETATANQSTLGVFLRMPRVNDFSEISNRAKKLGIFLVRGGLIRQARVIFFIFMPNTHKSNFPKQERLRSLHPLPLYPESNM